MTSNHTNHANHADRQQCHVIKHNIAPHRTLYEIAWCVCAVDPQVHPSDERIASVILEIGDFMLEFSTLGHEEAADIPQFVHPRIPNQVRPPPLPN